MQSTRWAAKHVFERSCLFISSGIGLIGLNIWTPILIVKGLLVTLPLSPFFRGRRQGRQPLNPGAGPAPVSSPEAFGGNRRLYTAAPPAADPPRVDSGSPPVHDYTCNLQCILRVVFKKHRFLQGFVAFAVSRFHLGDVKKPLVFHGFGSAAGVRNGQLAVLTALVPTSGQHRPRSGLHGPT